MPSSTRLEASVTHSICTQLENLGWIVDEKSPHCNVTQQRARTSEQQQKLGGKKPDFVLYKQDSSIPIAVIEAKKPKESLTNALKQAEERYATPLNSPLIFAYNDTYVVTRYLFNGRPLKVDGEDVRQFIDHYTALRFIDEGAEILSAPEHVQYSREQLIGIFKRAANLLREAGLQAGLERFGAFSDILFMKIMDEVCERRLKAGEEAPLPEHVRWSHFQDFSPIDQYKYVKEVVWEEMNDKYGEIFSASLPIDSHEILNEIITELSPLHLTAADTDVKGDAFEYFLKNAYQGLSIKDLGEYFTPRNIVRTMVSMVSPKIGETVYDPFCGTGGFLIETFRYLKIRTKGNKFERMLQNDTVYGSEITANARIAKMNMILFGDGHSNIEKHDSLANPKKGKFDIVLTNPPYSQKTRYGDLYDVPSTDGDAVCLQHCFESLNENGRAAILVKEDFLSDKGDVGKTREFIMKNSNNFSVVSLPRKLFEPYTPTKTSIVYFEKAGKRKSTYFYVVKKVGHTLGSRKKSIPQNDLPLMLDAFNDSDKSMEIDSWIVDNSQIAANNFCLWGYDYMEVIPDSPYKTDYLGNYIKESGEKVSPSDFPDDEFTILGVSNKVGVFENETLMGDQIKQKYIRVNTSDLVYNPHRVNVGSIGIVNEEDDGGYMSGIYVVFHSKDEKKAPPEFIVSLLKSEPYRKVIEAYDTKYGAVRANLTYDMLCRIRIPILPPNEMKKFTEKQKSLREAKNEWEKRKRNTEQYINSVTSSGNQTNPYHLEDFNTVLEQATKDS